MSQERQRTAIKKTAQSGCKNTQRRTLRAPMSLALGVALGGFVLLSVAVVMGVGMWSNYENTSGLLREKASILLTSAESRVRGYLGQAEQQADFIRSMIESGEVVAEDGEAFTSLLFGALAAAPQVVSIMHLDPQLEVQGVERRDGEATPFFLRARDDRDLAEALRQAADSRAGSWSRPIWRSEHQATLLRYVIPVADADGMGAIVALVSLESLSAFIGELEAGFGSNAFILYGRDQVLAHPLMQYGYPGLNALQPMPRRERFGDPVLGRMWEDSAEVNARSNVIGGTESHSISIGDRSYVFLHRELKGYSDQPLVVGTYFQAQSLLASFDRLKLAAAVCFLVLVAAVTIAGLIGRSIARPVRRLAEAARRVHHLDLSSVAPMPGSFFSELNDAAGSFNAMLDGLRWFERYVPRRLVRTLMSMGQSGELEPAERHVTVMFADIVGFTGLAEDLKPGELADFLNSHFSRLAACIEAEGGMVDKFIGDSVMAVWGALEPQDDAAERACRAALAIEASLSAINALRQAQGRAPVRLRIGIHSGPVTIGNIGSPGRVNYTVVGDTVNIAKRLDEAGKAWDRGATAVIALSGQTRRELKQPFDLAFAGLRHVRGRNAPVEAYRLLTRPQDERVTPFRPRSPRLQTAEQPVSLNAFGGR